MAGKMEAEGAVPYEWEGANTWVNRPYIFRLNILINNPLKNRIAELSKRHGGSRVATGSARVNEMQSARTWRRLCTGRF